MATRTHLEEEDDFGGGDFPGSGTRRAGTKRSFGVVDDDDDDDFFGLDKGKLEETAPGVATGMILSLRESLQNCKDTLTTCQTELEAARSEIQKWHSAFENEPYIPAGTSPEPGLVVSYLQTLKSSEESLREQLDKAKKKEAAFIVTFAKREQEIAELKSAVRDLKSQLKPASVQVGTIESAPSGNEKGSFGNNPQLKKRFIELCLREVNTCGYQGNSLKSVSWDRIKKEIHKEFGLIFKQKDIKNKWDYLRKSYQAWKYLLNKTGNEYNATTVTFDWPQSVWDDVIRQYPKSKKFRNKPLEYANELRTLFEGTVANRDNALVSARKKLPIDVPHSEHESSRTDAPGDPTASEQGAQSDIGTSHSSGKRKRKTTSEDVDMKAEVRDLICLIKDQVVSGKAKEGPSLDDCTQVMNELLHGGSINMRVYHGALLKFCECENYRKAFMGMESLEHRIFFLTTMVGGI